MRFFIVKANKFNDIIQKDSFCVVCGTVFFIAQIRTHSLSPSTNPNLIFHPLTTFLNKIKKTANKILKMSDKQGIEIHNESDISKLSFKDETMKGDAYYAYRCL